jgi:LacI family transcriptional regulator
MEKKFSKETVEKVKQAAAEMGYETNHFARSLKTGKTNIIGITFYGRRQLTSFTDPYLSEIYAGIGAYVTDHNYKLIFHSIQSDAQIDQTLELAQQGIVDGLVYILFSSVFDRFHQDLAPYLKRLKIPVVLVHSSTEDFGFPAVGLNCVQGGRLAAEHLIGHGLRDISIVVPSTEIEIYRDFMEGFADALAAGQLPFDAGRVITTPGFNYEHGTETARRLLEQGHRPPRALFVTEDALAYGLMDTFVAAGVRVPDDVAIIGFGDHGIGTFRNTNLTSIKQPAREKGEKAAELLLSMMQNGQGPDNVNRLTVLEPTLTVRQSCGCSPTTNGKRRTK